MAGAVNIPIGVTISDLVSGLKQGSQVVGSFTAQFKAQFNGLKGTADAPAGAFASLSRQLRSTGREMRDIIAVGGQPSTELIKKYALLKRSVDGVNSSFNSPIKLSPYQSLNQNLAETKSRIQDILAEGKKVPTALSSQFNLLNRQVSTINNTFSAKSSGGLGGLMGLGGLTTFAGGILSVTAAIGALKQGLQITSDIQRLNTSLRAVSSSSIDYANTQRFLRGASDSLGLSYEVLAGSYKGLKAATNGTNLEGKETQRIFMSVVKAGAALQLSNDEVHGTLLALQQMVSKGKVSMEELRQQLGERLPGAIKLMAAGLGVTEEKLNKMLEQGGVLAVDALPKLADQLEKTYGAQAQNNVNTLAGGFTRLTDQIKLFVAEFAQTNHVDSFFGKLGNKLANYTKGLREAQARGESIFLLSGQRRSELTYQSYLRDQFVGQDSGTRAATLKNLQIQADDYRNKIANPQKFGYNEAVVNANRRALKDVEERIIILKRENLKLTVGEREESEKLVKIAISGSSRLNIDDLKKKQSAKAEDLQNAILNNDPASKISKLRSEYNSLTSQIERATSATQKQKAAYTGKTTWSALETLERAQKGLFQNLSDALASGNADAIRTISHELENVERAIRRIRGEEEKSTLLRGLKRNPLGDIMQGGEDRRAKFQDALASRMNAGFDSFNINNAIRERIRQSGGLGLGEFAEILRTGQVDIKNKVDAFKSYMGIAKDQLASAGVGLLEGFGSAIGSGENPLKFILKTITGFIGDFAIKLGSAILLMGKLESVAAAIPGLAPLFALTGPAKIAVGAGLVVGGAAIKAMGAFAKGGIVSGPTLGLVGEYAGARNNPEVIAPLDRLTSLIQPRSGAQVFIPDILLQGSMIRIALERDDAYNGRFR